MNRINSYLAAVGVIGLCLWGVYWLLPVYAEHNDTRRQLDDVDRNLMDLHQERDGLVKEINELQNEPRAVERVAREKFGWSRPEEKIYYFPDAARSDVGTNGQELSR